MRVIQIQYANPDKFYNKKSLEQDLKISVRTFERYLLNDELKKGNSSWKVKSLFGRRCE